MYLVFWRFSKTLVLLCSVNSTFFSIFPRKSDYVTVPSKFIVEIDDNAIVVIYVDLLSCLLKWNAIFLSSFW